MNPYQMKKEDVLTMLGTDENGLTQNQAKENQKKYGKNELAEGKKKNPFILFLEQYKDFLVIILIIAAIISGVLGDIESAIVIFVVITINAILGTVQHIKAEQSLDSLKEMSAPTAKVIRDGEIKVVEGKDVTVGDIVVIEAGDYVCSDGRIIENASLKVDEMGTKEKKVNLTGAVTNVDISQIQTPATSLTNMLGGRVPGIISVQSSGEPGSNMSEFWIRGIGTFGASSSALVLIDGLEGDLNSIDPADIESFSVLKDASATAVYGVRGANGVVLVTTKHGTSDKMEVNVRANVKISYLTKLPEYLRAYDYAVLANEASAMRGAQPIYDDIELKAIQYHLDPDFYPDVNWQEEILKRTSLQLNCKYEEQHR